MLRIEDVIGAGYKRFEGEIYNRECDEMYEKEFGDPRKRICLSLYKGC